MEPLDWIPVSTRVQQRRVVRRWTGHQAISLFGTKMTHVTACMSTRDLAASDALLKASRRQFLQRATKGATAALKLEVPEDAFQAKFKRETKKKKVKGYVYLND